MASTNRTGRVSAIDYEAGTYEVTYFDRGQRVTRKINAISNGEYKMPVIGQIVSVAHTSSGLAAATTTGTVWNKTNRPAEGFKGLYRKEYGSQKGRAYSRYDENTGVYTQYVDKRTGRTCNGEIFDEAKGPISLVAGGQFQAKSSSASIRLNAKTGVGLVAGTSVSIEAGSFASIEAAGELSVSAGGKYTLTVTKGVEVEVSGGEAKIALNGAVITVTEAKSTCRPRRSRRRHRRAILSYKGKALSTTRTRTAWAAGLHRQSKEEIAHGAGELYGGVIHGERPAHPDTERPERTGRKRVGNPQPNRGEGKEPVDCAQAAEIFV